MRYRRLNHQPPSGFTLIELMIATTVFSVILLICLASFIQIGRMYYKGITEARTQEVTRAVMDDISRQIQFSGSTISAAAPDHFCIGTTRYSFVLNRELSDSPTLKPWQSKNVLQRDTLGSAAVGCPSKAVTPLNNPVELLSENMRLVTLKVTTNPTWSGRLWQVDVKVLYGDNDVLYDSTGQVTSGPNYNASSAECQGFAFSSQFCATSALSTIVERRLQ
jgi:prepilin-type N-terminal cleavage/methylation domain-containing protein